MNRNWNWLRSRKVTPAINSVTKSGRVYNLVLHFILSACFVSYSPRQLPRSGVCGSKMVLGEVLLLILHQKRTRAGSQLVKRVRPVQFLPTQYQMYL